MAANPLQFFSSLVDENGLSEFNEKYHEYHLELPAKYNKAKEGYEYNDPYIKDGCMTFTQYVSDNVKHQSKLLITTIDNTMLGFKHVKQQETYISTIKRQFDDLIQQAESSTSIAKHPVIKETLESIIKKITNKYPSTVTHSAAVTLTNKLNNSMELISTHPLQFFIADIMHKGQNVREPMMDKELEKELQREMAEIDEEMREMLEASRKKHVYSEADKAITRIEELLLGKANPEERNEIMQQLSSRIDFLFNELQKCTYKDVMVEEGLLRVKHVVDSYKTSPTVTGKEKLKWNKKAKDFVELFGSLVKDKTISYKGESDTEPIVQVLHSLFEIKKTKGEGEISAGTLSTYFKKYNTGEPF